mmetsp:Transcript_35839/g.86665  ORF Transcript_35839/g.86665 Transcript_35839/m.86665 type:complete len:316 (-) Transcript_35839:744-1691(-)
MVRSGSGSKNRGTEGGSIVFVSVFIPFVCCPIFVHFRFFPASKIINYNWNINRWCSGWRISSSNVASGRILVLVSNVNAKIGLANIIRLGHTHRKSHSLVSKIKGSVVLVDKGITQDPSRNAIASNNTQDTGIAKAGRNLENQVFLFHNISNTVCNEFQVEEWFITFNDGSIKSLGPHTINFLWWSKVGRGSIHDEALGIVQYCELSDIIGWSHNVTGSSIHDSHIGRGHFGASNLDHIQGKVPKAVKLLAICWIVEFAQGVPIQTSRVVLLVDSSQDKLRCRIGWSWIDSTFQVPVQIRSPLKFGIIGIVIRSR